MIDFKGTHGIKSKAAEGLAKILTDLNEEKWIHKVNAHVRRFISQLKALNGAGIHKQFYMKYALSEMQRAIKNYKYPIEIETRLLNVI